MKVFTKLLMALALTIPLHAQLTTIQGSDTVSASRTTINNNFTWLNNNKAALSHVHIIGDITGLQTQLDGKEAANSNIQAHIISTSNPHNVTKTQVGLGNVENVDTRSASTAPQKGDGSGGFVNATASDIKGLFNSCGTDGTKYLGDDGACHSASGLSVDYGSLDDGTPATTLARQELCISDTVSYSALTAAATNQEINSTLPSALTGDFIFTRAEIRETTTFGAGTSGLVSLSASLGRTGSTSHTELIGQFPLMGAATPAWVETIPRGAVKGVGNTYTQLVIWFNGDGTHNFGNNTTTSLASGELRWTVCGYFTGLN